MNEKNQEPKRGVKITIPIRIIQDLKGRGISMSKLVTRLLEMYLKNPDMINDRTELERKQKSLFDMTKEWDAANGDTRSVALRRRRWAKTGSDLEKEIGSSILRQLRSLIETGEVKVAMNEYNRPIYIKAKVPKKLSKEAFDKLTTNRHRLGKSAGKTACKKPKTQSTGINWDRIGSGRWKEINRKNKSRTE